MAHLDAISLLICAGALASALGCKSIDRFDTGPNNAYCLELSGEGFAESGMLPDDAGTAAVPADHLRLALTVDTQNVATSIGTLWSNDAEFGICGPRPLFDHVAVRTIRPALNDAVSSVQLTPDHIQDVFGWVDSTCQGTMMSIVSLIDGGTVEVRLFKPKPQSDESGPAAERPGFGVFARSQRAASCGF